MGFSHFSSNVVGQTGNEYIATLAKVQATTGAFATLTGSTSLSVPIVSASSYVKIGTAQYIFVGDSNTEATIIAEATALVATPIKGSMYMSTQGKFWGYTSDTTASPFGAIA